MLTVDIAGNDVVLYSTADVATMLHVSVRTARDYIKKGRLPTVLIDRHPLIPAAALRDFLTAADRRPHRDGIGGRKDSGADFFEIENEEVLI